MEEELKVNVETNDNQTAEVEQMVNEQTEKLEENVQEPTLKRNYPFDSPEVRDESNTFFILQLVVRKIDQVFDCPVVNNFNARQQDLADQLDTVRMDLYDVLTESKVIKKIFKNILTNYTCYYIVERMSEEVRASKQAKFGNHSQITKNKIDLGLTINKSK